MPSYDDATLRRLLDLQAEDSAVDRLEHQKETLPEAARLREINEQLAELTADLEIATKQHDEIAREQNRLEGETGMVDEKISREEQRMYSGKVNNPKELSALQAEVESLKRKRGGIEDELLEVMVQRESATATMDSLKSEHDTLSQTAEELQRTVTSLTADLDGQLESHRAQRAEVAKEIPDDLLATYEKIRQSKGGVGAAALEGFTCSGCHTKLPNVEVEKMRAERGLQRCDNCRRILVIR